MELAYTIIPLFLSVLLGHVSSARFLILVTGQGMVEEEIGRSDHRPPRVNMNFLPSMELMARQLANIRSLPRGKREETCLHEFLNAKLRNAIRVLEFETILSSVISFRKRTINLSNQGILWWSTTQDGKNLSPFQGEEERKMLTRWVIYREETSRFEGKGKEKKTNIGRTKEEPLSSQID